jgi:hypothetical protein
MNVKVEEALLGLCHSCQRVVVQQVGHSARVLAGASPRCARPSDLSAPKRGEGRHHD